jgi:hypothetical protein
MGVELKKRCWGWRKDSGFGAGRTGNCAFGGAGRTGGRAFGAGYGVRFLWSLAVRVVGDLTPASL